jgi:hypothetical protein
VPTLIDGTDVGDFYGALRAVVAFVGFPQAWSNMTSGIINFMRNVDAGVANLVREIVAKESDVFAPG